MLSTSHRTLAARQSIENLSAVGSNFQVEGVLLFCVLLTYSTPLNPLSSATRYLHINSSCIRTLHILQLPIQKSTLHNNHTWLPFPLFLHHHIQTFKYSFNLTITVDVDADYGWCIAYHRLFTEGAYCCHFFGYECVSECKFAFGISFYRVHIMYCKLKVIICQRIQNRMRLNFWW